MEHRLGDLTVVGEQEQPLGIEVQTADREQARFPRLGRQEIQHGRPPLRISRGGDDPARLVQDPVAPGLRDDGAPVQFDLVLIRVCGRAESGDHAVDAHAPEANQLLGSPPGRHARPGQDLLQP